MGNLIKHFIPCLMGEDTWIVEVEEDPADPVQPIRIAAYNREDNPDGVEGGTCWISPEAATELVGIILSILAKSRDIEAKKEAAGE